jgi:Zn-dependent protease with chaperone function
MNKLKQIALAVTLAACAGAAPAQQKETQVQDGIQVRPMPRYRVLASEDQMEQQAKQQYAAMMTEAQKQDALAPSNHPQVIRLRTIAKRIIPYSTRWNPAASKWNWQVNLIGSDQINAFCMPGGRIGFFSGILTKLKADR